MLQKKQHSERGEGNDFVLVGKNKLSSRPILRDIGLEIDEKVDHESDFSSVISKQTKDHPSCLHASLLRKTFLLSGWGLTRINHPPIRKWKC